MKAAVPIEAKKTAEAEARRFRTVSVCGFRINDFGLCTQGCGFRSSGFWECLGYEFHHTQATIERGPSHREPRLNLQALGA